MKKWTLIICAVVVPLSFAEAFAAPSQEIVQPRGLLLLGGLQQSVTLSYDYFSLNSDNFSSRLNRFRERYHLDTAAAIIDPRLLNIQLGADLWFDQELYSSGSSESNTSKNLKLRYSLTATAFDRDPYPITINSSQDEAFVTTGYTPSYTATTSNNGIRARLLNGIVPLLFVYQRTSLETSGLAHDSDTTTDLFLFTATNNYRDASYTELTTSYTSQQDNVEGLEAKKSRTYSLALSNSLYFDAKKKYSLGSSLQTQSARTADIPQQTVDLTETFFARFGNALQGNATYWFSRSKTVGFDNKDQVLKTNNLSASLSHRLAQSIDTRFTGRYRQSEFLDGTESRYGGAAVVNYRKKLPQKSNLTMSVNLEHQVTDRSLQGSRLSVRDEQHVAPQQGDSITLDIAGKLVSVVSVESRNPDQFYFEGFDYLVNLALGTIQILPGGSIAPGTPLFISYTVDFDPSLKYATDSVSASSSVSFLENRYRLLGTVSFQDQTLISGRVANDSLFGTRTSLVHFDANYPHNIFSAEYADYSSGPTNYSYIEGGWRFDKQFSLSEFTLRVRDRYTMFEPITDTGTGHAENSFNLGSSYSRNLFSFWRVLTSLNYVNVRGSGVARDFLYFKADLVGRFNRLLINLSGQTMYRITGSQTSRDDTVHFEITRFF